ICRGAAQTATWIASPPAPTAGATIWLERTIAVPAGWQVRAGKLDATEAVEPLADPAVLRRGGGWVVRYAVVAWKPGVHRLGLPHLWLLGPDGRADSTAGGTTSLSVASVIPDSLLRPSPQGLLAPLRAAHRDPLPPLAALALAAGLLATGVVVRRRRPRTLEPAPPVPLEREVPDTRWLAAGEPKAVAERAIGRLRAALARAVPEAHSALDTAECLAVVERARPDAPLRELRDLLEQLDRGSRASRSRSAAPASAPGSSPPRGPASALRAAKRGARGSPSCWPWTSRAACRRKTSRRRTASTSPSRPRSSSCGPAPRTASGSSRSPARRSPRFPSRPTTPCWSRRCASCIRASSRTA